MFWHDHCVACSGIGAFLNLEGVCTCPAFAIFNEEDGVCSCGEGFLTYNEKTCISCSGVGATLTEAGICTCGVNAMLDLIDGRLECICKPGYLASESDPDQCYLCNNGTFYFHCFESFQLWPIVYEPSTLYVQAPQII